jgi:hypothetical protein
MAIVSEYLLVYADERHSCFDYPDFIQAIENTDDERHEELLEWIGGSFDPEAFDTAL